MDSEITPRKLLLAARAGDLTAFRALADWLRERNRPPAQEAGYGDAALAFFLEAFAFEVEERHVQARKNRRLLGLLAASGSPLHMLRQRLDPRRVDELLRTHGLAVGVRHETGVYPAVQNGRAVQVSRRPVEGVTARTVYILLVPTDGTQESETCALLVQFLSGHFPTALFGVEFRNTPLSFAGGDAEGWLESDEFEPAGELQE